MLFEPLFKSAQRDPGKVAIVDDRGRYTYKQLANMAAGLGMYIGMQTQRSHVGLLLPGGAGFVASFYGTLLAGKTVVPLNFLLGDKEIAHIVKDSGIDTVLTAPPLMARVQNSGLNVVDLTQLPREIPDFEPEFPNPRADDIAVLMYTSGTSGLPKGVLLTYGNLQSDVDSAIEHAQLQHEHVFLGVIPLFHAFGMTAMMLAPLQLGATIIYIARFSPVAALNAIREHKVSLMFGVPSMYAAIARLKDAKPEDFATIYAMISGGEPLPSALRDAFMKRFNVHVFEGYGLTETSPVISLNVPQNFREGSVGRAVPGAEFKFTDEDGKALGTEEIGEIWVKGPMVMKGYNNLPNETGQALSPDGYFKTGDLGKIDADGFIFITGRKKDMISVAGEKAYPREIEEVLMANPAVAEAAVVGKKDPSRGEVVAAFVIFKEGQTLSADALREFCREHGLAQWKIPRDIQIVTDFPRTPTGKVLKRELAAKLNG
ncbi:MAG TPA: AMP-binding protein [Tepidisphaeraceae bacterium]|nr:AMP-binding protein [Tepidisphaeraceae bacterium]